MSTRIGWVDTYKGILILLVLIGHAADGLVADASFYSNSQYEMVSIVRRLIYSFHMPAFFIASGFFSGGLYKRDLRLQLKTKAVRLGKPYFVWGLIVAIVMETMRDYTNNGRGIAKFLKSPFVPSGNIWYLYVLFWIFMLHVVLSALFKKRADTVLLAMSIAMFVAYPWVPKWWVLKRLCRYALFYAIGAHVYPVMAKRVSSNVGQLIASVLLFSFSFACVLYFKKPSPSIAQSLYFLTSMTGAFLVYSISSLESPADSHVYRFLSYCGRESMALYMIHVLWVPGLRIALSKFMHINNMLLILVVASALGTTLTVLCTKALRHFNLYKHLF